MTRLERILHELWLREFAWESIEVFAPIYDLICEMMAQCGLVFARPKCIPIVATQSVSSLKDALPNEGVKTLLQALRNKVFLTTTDPETARYASELCGKADRTRISYTVSESSTNANVGWLSGRTSSSRFRFRIEAVPET